MKITQLTAKNFKQQNFTEDLAGVTLITGPNSKGKSARLEALSLACLGYVPGYSAKPSDLFALFATGNPMAVGYNNGTGGVLRQWREERGSVKYSGPEAGALPAVALDPAAYFELSGPERVKFLFSASGAARALDKSKLAATLCANVKNIKLEQNTLQSEEVILDTSEWISEFVNVGIGGVQEWIESLFDAAKEKFKLAKQNVARLEKTQQGNVQAQHPLVEAAGGNVPPPQDAEAKLATAREELRAAEAEATRVQTELDAARAEFRTQNALAAGATDEGAARARMAELDAERARLFALCQGEPSDKAEFAAWQQVVDAFNRADKALAAADKDAERITGELEHAQYEKTCPTCGQSTVEIKKKMVAALKDELKAYKKVSKECAARFDDESHAKALAEEALRNKQAAVAAHQQHAAGYRKAAQEHADLQAKLAGSEKALEAAKKLPELAKQGALLASQLQLKQQSVSLHKEDVAACEEKAKRLLDERFQARQRAEVADALEKARAEAAVLNEFAGKRDSILATLQAELVEKAVGPLVARINELCQPILPAPVAFRDGELLLGTWSHKTASDSEKLLLYAALSVALAAESPLKVAAIGRLESFDAEKKPRLVRLLLDLVKAGRLDQAVMVEVDTGGADWTAQFAGEDFKKIVL